MRKYIIISINLLLCIIILNFNCTPFSRIDRITKKDYNRLSKIKKFTVVIVDKVGNDNIQIEQYRAGFFFSKEDKNLKGMLKLNALYGKAISLALQNGIVGLGKPEYVPPDKLYLIQTEKGEEDLNRAWFITMGIDAVFSINQERITLDYMSRVPNIGLFNIIYPFLLLDLWYVDFFGPWYLKNDLSYTILFPKTSKWFRVEEQTKSVSLGTFFNNKIQIPDIEMAIVNSAYSIFMESLKYED